jgi:hypothetical protein
MGLPAQLPVPPAAAEPRIAPAQDPPTGAVEVLNDSAQVEEALLDAAPQPEPPEDPEAEERVERQASRARQRAPAPVDRAPAPRARPDPPSPQPVDESAEAPEWIISPSNTGRARPPRKPVASGTNDALIFD